jgi:acyl dehydratase
VFRSRLGRTISEADNTWCTLLTMNANQNALQRRTAARTEFQRPLVVSSLTLAIVRGLFVADTSENAIANLGWNPKTHTNCTTTAPKQSPAPSGAQPKSTSTATEVTR